MTEKSDKYVILSLSQDLRKNRSRNKFGMTKEKASPDGGRTKENTRSIKIKEKQHGNRRNKQQQTDYQTDSS